MILRELKKNPHRAFSVFENTEAEETLSVTTEKGAVYTLNPTDFPISDRTSNGSFLTDEKNDGAVFETHPIVSFETDQNEA